MFKPRRSGRGGGGLSDGICSSVYGDDTGFDPSPCLFIYLFIFFINRPDSCGLPLNSFSPSHLCHQSTSSQWFVVSVDLMCHLFGDTSET